MEAVRFDTEIISSSAEETESIAAKFFANIPRGSIITLHGELGAGKTTFVRGFAVAAGVKREVINSPSFTIINEYPVDDFSIYHFDLYRIGDPSELIAIGADEYFLKNGYCLIEWAENGEEFIPTERYDINLAIVDESKRSLFLRKSV